MTRFRSSLLGYGDAGETDAAPAGMFLFDFLISFIISCEYFSNRHIVIVSVYILHSCSLFLLNSSAVVNAIGLFRSFPVEETDISKRLLLCRLPTAWSLCGGSCTSCP